VRDRVYWLKIALLWAGCAACSASIVDTLHKHGKLYPGYAAELAQGLWKYGPLGVFDDPPVPSVRLSDLSTAHAKCGPSCSAKGGER
jgi:hypothetical protein